MTTNASQPIVRRAVKDAPSEAWLADVCSRANVTLEVTPGDTPPALVIGQLPPGQRTMPAGVIKTLAEIDLNAPVLLFTSEKLVRPCVRMANGQVHLMQSSADPDVVAAHLRDLAAGHAVSRPLIACETGVFHVHEFWGKTFWAARVVRLSRPQTAWMEGFALEKRRDGVFGCMPTAAPDQSYLGALEKIYLNDDLDLAGCAAEVGPLPSTITYTDATGRIRIAIGVDPTLLTVVSPTRLPQIAARNSAGVGPTDRPLEFATRSGDLFVLTHGADELPADFLEVARQSGGRAGLELLQRLEKPKTDIAMLFLEVL